MAKTDSIKSEDVREVLINAVEVELAALKAAVGFWTQWIELTSKFVKTTGANLSSIRSSSKNANHVLLEAVDASRETARLMTELPKRAAEDFLSELDAIEHRRAGLERPPPKRRGRAKT
jgi:hypothetical protein